MKGVSADSNEVSWNFVWNSITDKQNDEGWHIPTNQWWTTEESDWTGTRMMKIHRVSTSEATDLSGYNCNTVILSLLKSRVWAETQGTHKSLK